MKPELRNLSKDTLLTMRGVEAAESAGFNSPQRSAGKFIGHPAAKYETPKKI